MIYPTKEIVDDYMAMVDAGLCTRTCGAARDDICQCRCKGEFHNLLRDWWASPEFRSTSTHFCGHCGTVHAGNRCVGQHQCAPTCRAWKEPATRGQQHACACLCPRHRGEVHPGLRSNCSICLCIHTWRG